MIQESVFVQVLIERTLHQTVTLGRNDRLNAITRKMLKNGITIVGLVGTE